MALASPSSTDSPRPQSDFAQKEKPGKRRALWKSSWLFVAVLFAFFKHVLDAALVDHQVRAAGVAIQLDACPVVPLDDAVEFFSVVGHNDHRSFRLHLLLIVKIFRVCLLGWRSFLRRCSSCRRRQTFPTLSAFRSVSLSQRWANQLPAGESFGFGSATYGCRFHSTLHKNLPTRTAATIAETLGVSGSQINRRDTLVPRAEDLDLLPVMGLVNFENTLPHVVGPNNLSCL